MVGCIVLGGLTAVVLARLWHRRHWGGGCWGGHGWGGHHWHRGGHRFGPGGFYDPDGGDGFGPDFPGAGRRRGMSFALRYVSDRIEATPAQERAMAQAMDELRSEVEPLGQEMKKSRADLAAAMRRPAVDEVLFGELFARQDQALEKARKALIGAVAKVHEALDERQRDRLADLIERGPRFFGFGRH